MTVSATLKFKTAIKKEEFNKFASQNEIKRVRNTYYYRGKDGVKIVFSKNEITVSSSVPDRLSCAFISKKILEKFTGTYFCSDELVCYLPPRLFGKQEVT